MIPFPHFKPCASRRAARGKTFARGWMCFASRLRFHRLFLAVVSLLTIGTVAPSARAGLVFSDDFATDPFASRWTNTAAGGSYLPVWTGNTTPNPTWSAGLPTNANNNSVYSGACTSQSMSTTDTSVPAAAAGWNTMTYSVDFQVGGTNVGNSIGVLVNRSGNNGYTAAIYTGGSGNILWAGDYGSTTWAGHTLAAGTWYRFKTTVTKSGADLSMQSRILDLGGNVLATSPTKTITNAAYTDPHGFQLNFGSDGYWDRARQIDNLRVEVTTLAFTDDFGINPLLAPNPRWNATAQTNSYTVLWTGLLDLGDTNVFGGNGVSLPTNANAHCLYAFSDGWRTFSTISTTNPVSGWTTQSYQIDFCLGGTASTLSGMSLAVVVNRNGTNGYRSAFSIGSSDRVKWIGSYGSTSLATPALATNVWYRLITDVARAGSTNTMQARIVRVSDGAVLHSSPLYADSTGQYPDPNGFLLENGNGTGTGFYWSRAMQLDNFQVSSDVPGPAWLDNSLGKDTNVPAPWTAVTVSNHTVNVWGRSYRFNDLGLPAALISQGQDLFGGTAMLVNALVDGQALTFNATNALQFDTTRADQVVVTATAAANVSGVTLVVTNTIEFDGFVRSRIYLSGSGSNTLNQFWLDTSLASTNSQYFLPRFGYDAAIPASGIKRPLQADPEFTATWTNKQLYWVGGDDIGLYLSAEDDRTWQSASRDEAQELIPQAGRTVWRYHVVDSNRSLATPQMLDFCYMATPVKPVTNWYAQRVSGDAGYDMTNVVTESGQPCTLTCNYVANGAALGIRQMAFHEQWTSVMGYPGIDAAHAGSLSSLAGAFQANGMNLCLYSQTVLSDAAPEFNRWGAEWSATWPAAYGAFTRDTNFSGVVPQSVFWCSQNSAWSDFYIWNWLRLQQNYGVSGVYMDGTFGPAWDTNPNRPNAYVVNGVCYPTRPIYATREFMKRWYKTAKGQNPNFFFLAHASDAFCMSSLSFADYTMGGEEFRQVSTNELDWSLLRAAYTGHQFGIRRDIYTTGAYQEPYMIPLAMVHGIGVFGRGASTVVSTYIKPMWDVWDSFGVSATNCTWVPYWKGTLAVTSSTPDVKVSYYKRPGTILLCAATNKRTRPAASVGINLAALGINPAHFVVKRFGQSIINSNQVNGTLTLSFLDNLSNPSGVPDYVIITDTNRAPVATPRSISTAWQTPVAITLAGTDADGDTLTFAVDSPPAHGLLSGTAPALTYTPDASFSGTDSFTFHANDGWTNSASATITIIVGLAPPSVIVASDNFATDPFATNRWSTTYPGGSYPLLWTGSSNPNGFGGPSVSLPTNANAHSVYSFSDGTRTMSTTDTSVPAGLAGWTAMSYSVDFQMGGTGGTDNNYIEVLVNRNGTNGYKPGIYTGGGGHIAWAGDYGLAWTSPNLYVAANTWYRFETTVTRNGADLSMQSRILDLGGNVLATSPTTNFTSAAYADPHGFKLTLSNSGGYWNHASQIDNFVVKVAPGSVTRPTLNWTNPGGGQLQFSWTGSGSLQWQTNSLGTGLGTNWVDYPGGGSSPVNVTVNPAQGSVFFRVRAP